MEKKKKRKKKKKRIYLIVLGDILTIVDELYFEDLRHVQFHFRLFVTFILSRDMSEITAARH